ncbi:MAG: tRNA dihydrouridine(20/20a) synthase DusA [Gammaproteobacteria bacterium]|nr:MAG: tRNA dihydrouridine(20/20a) synthase DusA [Gammaproteobacteria bacterium]
MLSHKISIAPMISCTDRHFRYLVRLLTKHTVLYSEMITTGAVIFGDKERHLGFNEGENPVVFQLGGNDPAEMAKAAEIVESYNYDEININVGCPSERVQSGKFGACLMAEPELVAQCVKAMKQQLQIPVTIKTRLGFKDSYKYETLCNFIDVNAEAGCQTFIIHARTAKLDGFSPRQNRELIPVMYDEVYRLKQDYPQLTIVINGDITRREQISHHLEYVDGVMIGRAAYINPILLKQVDSEFYGVEDAGCITRKELVRNYIGYMDDQLKNGVPLHIMVKHIITIFQGYGGAKIWRRHISENITSTKGNIEDVNDGLLLVDDC